MFVLREYRLLTWWIIQNYEAVKNEHKQQSVPPSRLSDKQKQEQAAWLAKVDRIRSEAEAREEDPEVYAMRSMTAEEAAAEDKRQMKKKSGVFGWEVYSTEAHYRAHKKRVAGLEEQGDEYAVQKATAPNFYPEAGDLSYVSQPKVPQANIDRMARDLSEQVAKVCILASYVLLSGGAGNGPNSIQGADSSFGGPSR